jgi:hypothetical protein
VSQVLTEVSVNFGLVRKGGRCDPQNLMRWKHTILYTGLAFALVPAFRDDVRVLITPGTILIVTDQPVSGRTHSVPGFNILTAEGATSTSTSRVR